MEKIDTHYFKEKLLEEKSKLIAELQTIGKINPNNPDDWEPTIEEKGQAISDPNDSADSIEEYETNTAIVSELEIQLKEINVALEKIDLGTYGVCEISGDPIEIERLEANPSARTCKAHIEE
jgi:RNA polymerase-binding transcription factor DksA